MMICSPILIAGCLCVLAVSKTFGEETVTNGMPRQRVIAILGYPKGSMSSRKMETLMYERGVIDLVGGKVSNVSLLSPDEIERRKLLRQVRLVQQSKPVSIVATPGPRTSGITAKDEWNTPEPVVRVPPTAGFNQPTDTSSKVTEDGLGGYRVRDSEGKTIRVLPDYTGGYRATDEDGNVTRIRPDYTGGYRATDDKGNTARIRPDYLGGYKSTDNEGNTTRIESDGNGSSSSIRSSGSTVFRSDGETSTRIGNTWFHSSGETSTKVGNTVFHSDGDTSTKIGNTVFHSDGETSTRIGNNVFHSDGSTSTRIGNTIFSSDGSTTTVCP